MAFEPRESAPRPPAPARVRAPREEEDPLGPEPTTGANFASRDFVREVNKSGLFKVSWVMIAWVGFIGIGAISGWRAVAAEARDAGAAAVGPIEQRVKAVEQQVPQLREEVFEARKDMRALQEVIITRRRAERLAEPLTPPSKDGGQ